MNKVKTAAERVEKLEMLAEHWGYESTTEMLEERVTDSLVPGICMNEDCEYSTEVEPDCEAGWCEECDEGSIESAMILAGVI